jgi:acyl-CoA thioesterase-1
MKYLISTMIILLFTCCACRNMLQDEETYRQQIMKASVQKVTYLALGDSYTKGESVPVSESFPYQLADSLNHDPYIEVTETRVIAQTGWTTLSLKNAIANQSFDHPYDIVTLLIGVNNQYQGRSIEEYREDFKILLMKAVELAGNDKQKVTVVSIPDYGYTPFGAGDQQHISAEIDVFNAANKQITDSAGIRYINITPISRSSAGGLEANDGLHPSGKQYSLWVHEMGEAIMKQILGK